MSFNDEGVQYMQSRAFNSIHVDYQQNLLTKSSCNMAKIQDEVNYYLELPHQVAQYFPQLINYSKDYSSYTLEYIPYSNLAQLILDQQITEEDGKHIINQLFTILDHIHHCKESQPTSLFKIDQFYINKTIERIHQLKKLENFQKLLAASEITINGQTYLNFNLLQGKFIASFKEFIARHSEISVIHGDFCFSNILYCQNSKNIKLIDPRGSFDHKGIYGHPYYDYAKLLHCLHGNYDLIVNNHYQFIENQNNEFELHINHSSLLMNLNSYFKQILQKKGMDIQFLYLIKASLFLSMAALHYEDPQRQKALFFTGIMILNNFYWGKYANLH